MDHSAACAGCRRLGGMVVFQTQKRSELRRPPAVTAPPASGLDSADAPPGQKPNPSRGNVAHRYPHRFQECRNLL